MINASTLTTSIARLFNATQPNDKEQQALKHAYRTTSRYLSRDDASLFDFDFLQNEGAPIVDAYLNGKRSRHAAAQALAMAWHGAEQPIRARTQRWQVADTTMIADTFLVELAKQLDLS